MRSAIPLFATLFAVSSACGDGSSPLPIGSTCVTSAQCESSLCGGGSCLAPDGDEDGDGLSNLIEVALGTNPFSADTDGDGLDDLFEVGDPNAPNDEDGDGKIDAIESLIEDCDEDGIVDQLDPDDGADEFGRCHLRCVERLSAEILPINQSAFHDLPVGESFVYVAEVLPGDTYTLRIDRTSMESDPRLRVFAGFRALCEHANVARPFGLGRADGEHPPLAASTEPNDILEVEVPESTTELFFRVDAVGAGELGITGYSISAVLARR